MAEAQMRSHLDLAGVWKVTWNDGNHGSNDVQGFSQFNPLADTARYFDVPVPKDLNLVFQDKGWLDNLYTGINTFKARWVGEQYWQYCRTFAAPEEALHGAAWLVFERLDLNAVIFLNGEQVGAHANAHMPCRLEVTGKLRAGTNILVVAIESGLYGVADKEGSAYNAGIDTRLNKRHWQRKPQYQFSWDWNPLMINVGITGAARLEWSASPILNQVVTWTEMSDDLRSAELTVRPFIQSRREGEKVELEIAIEPSGLRQRYSVELKKGENVYPHRLTIKDPELWWPVGHGQPKLYTVTVTLFTGGKPCDVIIKRVGFRHIEVDRSKHPQEGNYFTVKINHRPIFLKGGNWVPADMIYSNVSRERLESLVNMALAANFNILRIWGGGLYAGNDLLSICDEKGVVVWHDMLFACAEYPGDDLEFYRNVKNEVRWAVREFAHHPSLIIWCGNNELEWGTFGWGYAERGKVVPDYILYHHLIPTILKEEDPFRFYWPSSPYSENYEFPNSKITGDQHPWVDWSIMDGFDLYMYRKFIDRFPNEGGVLGASSPATLKQFLPAKEQYIRSFSWEHHDNIVNFWSANGKGLTYRTVENYAGRDYRTMNMEDYAVLSGMLQAEGLTEYITNYHRRMFSTSCAIFWMYNDSWPVTHGWTIVDYYLRKKLAYHPVRRAFQPVTVVVADEDPLITIYGVNDSPSDWRGTLQYGLFSVDGHYPLRESRQVHLPSNGALKLFSFAKKAFVDAGIKTHGAFAVLKERDTVYAQHRIFLATFKELELKKPDVNIKYVDDRAIFTSPVFVWRACVDLDGEADVSDNCFDLLPNIPYSVKAINGEKITLKRSGNDFIK